MTSKIDYNALHLPTLECIRDTLAELERPKNAVDIVDHLIREVRARRGLPQPTDTRSSNAG